VAHRHGAGAIGGIGRLPDADQRARSCLTRGFDYRIAIRVERGIGEMNMAVGKDGHDRSGSRHGVHHPMPGPHPAQGA
jgi:hypothetical protein